MGIRIMSPCPVCGPGGVAVARAGLKSLGFDFAGMSGMAWRVLGLAHPIDRVDPAIGPGDAQGDGERAGPEHQGEGQAAGAF
jgi:hypothetical protein